MVGSQRLSGKYKVMSCYHYSFNTTKQLKVVYLVDPFDFVEARELGRAIQKAEGVNPKLSGLLLLNGLTKKQYGSSYHPLLSSLCRRFGLLDPCQESQSADRRWEGILGSLPTGSHCRCIFVLSGVLRVTCCIFRQDD